MARADGGVVGQGEQHFADAAHQSLVAAAGQVGAADALLEQHVTAEQQTGRGIIKGHMPGRMPRHKQYVKPYAAGRNSLTGRTQWAWLRAAPPLPPNPPAPAPP